MLRTYKHRYDPSSCDLKLM